MTREGAELAFFGEVFLQPDAGELQSIARELGLANWEAAARADAAGLETEHNRLFLNPSGSPCSLWQSANSKEQRLMGEPHLSALDWFRRFGAEPAAANEPADHIGLLLLFCSHLLETGAEPEAVERFRSEHLDWATGLCEAIGRATRLAFYRAVSERLRMILLAEIGRSDAMVQ